MSIRTKNKDHRAKLSPPLASVPASVVVEQATNSLRFSTQHATKPTPIDLTPLATGQHERKGGARWSGPFSGRSELIQQLAPAIQEELRYAPRATASGFIASLRRWWRLFDALEERAAQAGSAVPRIESVAQFSELHGQAALDANFDAHDIADLRRVADVTRQALGLRPLYWRGPGSRDSKRHLPPPDKVRLIWQALKRHWLQTLDRWSHAEQLLNGKVPTEQDEALLRNYRRFNEALKRVQSEGKFFPTAADIRNGLRQFEFTNLGLHLHMLYGGFFPTSTDVRMAFHLCLASSGWNPQTMLDLAVDSDASAPSRTPFLQSHPQDSARYVLQGFKSRGRSEHVIYGDWKTDRSPGVVLKTLVERSWPLRQALQQEMDRATTAYVHAAADGLSPQELSKLKHAVAKLQEGLRSPWLYCTARGEVEWLHEGNYRVMPNDVTRRTSVLDWLVDQINAANRLEGTNSVPYIVPSDFRDAFAAFVWRSTGGSVLHVMKALGHRALRTTFTYLNNTAVNAESARIFRTFSNALWKEIRVTRRLDMTVIAKLTQDGSISVVHTERLEQYRGLKRSRIGVGCKDPCHPPESIAPDFVPDGKAQCPVQRCTLCLEHAVVLPDSLDGLAMRMAELDWLKEHMPVDAFTGREFQNEHDNTAAALAGFDEEAVTRARLKWRTRIAQGEHRVVEFQGLARRAVRA